MSVPLALQALFAPTADGGGVVTAVTVIGLGVLLLARASRGVPGVSGADDPSSPSARERAGRPHPRAPSTRPAPA